MTYQGSKKAVWGRADIQIQFSVATSSRPFQPRQALRFQMVLSISVYTQLFSPPMGSKQDTQPPPPLEAGVKDSWI